MSDSDKLWDDFVKALDSLEPTEHCMYLSVHELGHAVELCLNTQSTFNGEWIPGEGADICLHRDIDTGKIVGCRLPLMCKRLVVQVNGGFHEFKIGE